MFHKTKFYGEILYNYVESQLDEVVQEIGETLETPSKIIREKLIDTKEHAKRQLALQSHTMNVRG